MSMNLEDRMKNGWSKTMGHTGFFNSPSSYDWPLPPQPYSPSLYEDIASLDRAPSYPFPHALPGDVAPPPEAALPESGLYKANAEGTLRRQTANRLMEQLPEMKREQELHHLKMQAHGYAPVMTGAAGSQGGVRRASPGVRPWSGTGLYIAPADVTSVGFQKYGPGTTQWQRTPVDTAGRLLRNYMTASEPAFMQEHPAYQAKRVGTLASEAPLSRTFGPCQPVQGLMHDGKHPHIRRPAL